MAPASSKKDEAGTSARGGGGGLMQTAATPLKAAASLFAGTVRWGIGLVTSPTSQPSSEAKGKGKVGDGPATSPPPNGVPPKQASPAVPEVQQRGKGPAPILSANEEYDLAGRRKSLPAFGSAEQPTFSDAVALGGASAQAVRSAQEPVLSPYQRRKTLSGSEFNLHGQAPIRKPERTNDYLGASANTLPTFGGGTTPRNPYENVRAILRQGREQRQSSVVDRYYSQQRQYSDQYQSYASESRRTPNLLTYQDPQPHSIDRFTPPQARTYGFGVDTVRGGHAPASTSAMKIFMGQGGAQPETPMDVGGGAAAATRERGALVVRSPAPGAMEVAGSGTERRRSEDGAKSPVHAFKRRTSWTPMRPSSTASRLKSLKRSFVTSQSQDQQPQPQQGDERGLDSVFKSPTKRLRPSPILPVYTRSAIMSPGDKLRRESLGGLKQGQTPKDSQITTETAKRILSTLDSLTSPPSGSKENRSVIPQKLKFSLPEADLGTPVPPPVDSLRHFSQTKPDAATNSGANAGAAKATPEPSAKKKKWPAAFLVANKKMVDDAVESVEKEIEAAKGGGPKPATPQAKAPTFTFGASNTAASGGVPPSPVFGLQSNDKAKEGEKPQFTFGAPKGFSFGVQQQPTQTSLSGKRTYAFGSTKLSDREQYFANAIASEVRSVQTSKKVFKFGQSGADSEDDAALLEKANSTAVQAASLPLPFDEETDAGQSPPAAAAPLAAKKWPASFLAKNKEQNDSAVAAVAEEIEKAKTPTPAIAAAKPGVPTFNFGAPAATDAAGEKEEADKPKFVFGAPPPSSGAEAKKQDTIFSFGATPAKKPAPLSENTAPSLFSFGATKPAEAKEAEPAKPSPFAFGSSASTAATGAPATIGFAFGSQAKAATEVATKTNKRKSEEEAPAAKKAVFTFGAQVAPTTTKPKEVASNVSVGNISSPFAFGSSTPAKQPSFGFGSVQSTEKKDSGQANAGEKPKEKEKKDGGDANPKSSAPVFAFGGSTSQPSQTSFGAAPSILGKPAAADPKPPASSASIAPSPFSFTASAAAPAEKPKETPAPASTGSAFGGSGSSGSAFQFGANATTAPAFGGSGLQSSQSGSKPAPFAFGAAALSSASQPASFSFGAGGASPFGGPAQTAPATPSAFGGSSTGASGGPAFAFGQNNGAASQSGSTFGSSGGFGGTPAASSGPSFGGFGGSGASTAASGGVFGTPTPASSTPFTFGASQPVGQAATPAFGSASSAPAFGAGAAASAPAFGGMGGGFGSASPAPGSFGFGSAQPQPGSGFGGAQLPSSGPAFGGSQMGMPPPQQNQGAPSFGSFGSPMPAPSGNAAASRGFSMGVGSAPRRKVKAKPSWRKK